MARAKTNKEFNTFIQGLITEANPLTFPENASIDEDNFVLKTDGSRERRLGIDFETSFSLVDSNILTTTANTQAIGVSVWRNINDSPTLGLVVVQIGNNLFFYDLFADPISAAPKNGGNAVVLPEGEVDQLIQTATSLGKLIIVNGSKFIHSLTYNEDTDTVSIEKRLIKIRDFFGVDDALAVDSRPTGLSNAHKYNLLNQGWTATAISKFRTDKGIHPSNSDIVQLGKDANEDFDSDILTKQFFGSTPAPKGRFIIDAFDRGASRAQKSGLPLQTVDDPNVILRDIFGTVEEGLSGARIFASSPSFPSATIGVPQDQSTKGPTAVAAYAGRLFYAGMGADLFKGDERSPQFNSYILFSKAILSSDDLTNCFQEADPTSEHISDIVDTDGGTLSIPEIGKVLKLLPIGDSLLVIADNGIWEIKGSDVAFSAVAFNVRKIGDIAPVNADAIVQAESVVLLWAKSGIYLIAPDQVSGNLVPQNISEATIQTFINDISEVAKAKARGTFDSASRQIRWMYNDTADYDGITSAYQYNRELVFDTVLQAFYPTTIGKLSTDSPFISAYLPVPNLVKTATIFDIVAGVDDVVVGADNVIISKDIVGRKDRALKYLTTQEVTGGNLKYTFSLFKDNTFTDWISSDTVGIDAPAFLITGYELLQDSQRHKQVTYLTAHFLRTEDGFSIDVNNELILDNQSSCLLQAQWEWADSAASGRFGPQFEIYRLKRMFLPKDLNDTFDYGFKTVVTKNKLRGKGRAISFKFNTSAKKDLKILGWGLDISGNQAV